jgi:FMN phosphatase YigB (HAD superfamily)
VVDSQKCALLDDSARNLHTAKKMGIFTILVGENGDQTQFDRSISHIHELPTVVPEFWETIKTNNSK